MRADFKIPLEATDRRVKCPCGRVVGLSWKVTQASTGPRRVLVYNRHTLPIRYRATGNGGTVPIKIKCSFSNQSFNG